MDATIENYRRGRHTEYGNQFIASVDGIETSEAAKALVGKPAVWKTPSGKEIKGKVASTHGNSGKIRVVMEKGLPGQAVGTTLQIA